MSKKRAGSASRPGTPANAGDDSGSEDDFKPQQQHGGVNKGKQAMQSSKPASNAPASGSGGGGGTADDDMNTLDDAVGYAGVDLNVG